MANLRPVRFEYSGRIPLTSINMDFGDGTHSNILPVDHDYNIDEIGPPYLVNVTLTGATSGKEGETVTKVLDLTPTTTTTTTTTTMAPTTTTTTLAPNPLVAHWKGENNTVDSVNGNDGVWAGGAPAYAIGYDGIGYCFKTQATNWAYLTAPHSLDYGMISGGKFTIEFYIYSDDMSMRNRIKKDNWNILVGENKVMITVTGVGSSTFAVTLLNNTWYKITVSYDIGTWSVKVNDMSISGINTYNPFINSTGDLKLVDVSDDFYESGFILIDEIKIFNNYL